MMPETRESLLIRVRDPRDDVSWQQFIAIYRPMIYRIARRQGLQDGDAEDLSQRVLVSVARAIKTFEKDPQQGTFRTWLSRVARNAIINFVTRGPQDDALGGTDFLEACRSVPEPSDDIESLIRHEHARSRIRAAATQVKQTVSANTWDAFWKTAVEGEPIERVALSLNMSVGAVYGARCRVMKQLQLVAASLSENSSIEEAR